MARSKHFTDVVHLQITCADTAAVLEKIGRYGFPLFDIETTSELTVCLRCRKNHSKEIESIAVKAGADVKEIGIYGPKRTIDRILRRPLLTITTLFFCIIVFFLPSRVLFIQVEGNETVPTKLILEEAEHCGISFGASRRWIRNETVKNALVSSIPQLQWVGINTSGCVATISVREKSTAQEEPSAVGPGSVVAARDGIIHAYTVLNGTAVCRVGEAVTAGQTLVSGYTDCGITIKSVRAQADITAQTLHHLTAVAPVSMHVRETQLHTETKYALRIGKKLINFYKDSGISDTSCVKMYLEDYLTLPGGFELPVALITQRWVYYTDTPHEVSSAELWLKNYCQHYLLSGMQAGQILRDNTTIQQGEGVYTFQGEYVCLEMIGQFVNEEIVNNG